MSYQEKSIYVSLISTLLVFGYYLAKLVGLYQAGNMNPSTVMSLVITVIVVMIIVNIISHIVFVIVNKIATREDGPDFADELDKLIELKATRNSHYVFMVAFMLTILGTLLIKIPILGMFVLVFVYLISSCIIGDISKLYLYRKGA